MFREQIGRVHLAVDLQQLELLAPQTLLNPQRVTFKMSEFAQPLSAANAEGSSGIRPVQTRMGNVSPMSL